jgi:hypothetical protein
MPTRKPREVRHFSRIINLGKELDDAAAAATAATDQGEKAALEALRDQAYQRLVSYKSRGHGRGGFQPRVAVPDRSKYQPHQGAKERARRLLQGLSPAARRVVQVTADELMEAA